MQELKNRIEQYEGINWKYLTREKDFPNKDHNFISQKELFKQVKKSFDILFDNIDFVEKNLPSNVLSQISVQVQQFLSLVGNINAYSDFSKHNEVADNIKNTCFNIKNELSKYVEYLESIINPSNIKQEIQKELTELSKIKKEINVSLQEGIKRKDEVNAMVEEKLKEIEQGTKESSEGKRKIASSDNAKHFYEQSERHRINAEGINNKNGWIRFRRRFFVAITVVIVLVIISYVTTFWFLDDNNKWKDLWDLKSGALFIALLTILYTGL